MSNLEKMMAEFKEWATAHFNGNDEEALVNAAGMAAKAAIAAIPMSGAVKAVAEGIVNEVESLASKSEAAQ